MNTKKVIFQDGVLDRTHEVVLSAEPFLYVCNTKDFARMVQLFRNMTEFIDFSQPFQAIIEYDPKGDKTVVRIYETKESLQQYNEQARGIGKD